MLASGDDAAVTIGTISIVMGRDWSESFASPGPDSGKIPGILHQRRLSRIALRSMRSTDKPPLTSSARQRKRRAVG
jgi:hypothetical protein